jgi:hypothetical protein
MQWRRGMGWSEGVQTRLVADAGVPPQAAPQLSRLDFRCFTPDTAGLPFNHCNGGIII